MSNREKEEAINGQAKAQMENMGCAAAGKKEPMMITPTIFASILESTMNTMRKLTASKGDEYKQGSSDQLANFKRGAERQDVHPLVIWRVYFDKHLDSIMGWIKDMRHGIYARSYSEPITERIDDAILYLILLKGFYYEQNPMQEAEFYADRPSPIKVDDRLYARMDKVLRNEVLGPLGREEAAAIRKEMGWSTPIRESIYAAISNEREHQDKKYGLVTEHMNTGARLIPQQGPGGHELGAWLVILEKELDEAKDAIIHGGNHTKGRDTVRSELVQIAAVCLAALEQHGLED